MLSGYDNLLVRVQRWAYFVLYRYFPQSGSGYSRVRGFMDSVTKIREAMMIALGVNAESGNVIKDNSEATEGKDSEVYGGNEAILCMRRVELSNSGLDVRNSE
jgi:hypothetical protein